MQIEQVRLSNWLSYPTSWEINGKIDLPCLRFDSDPVCLVFGKNGAGKSSIVDAILFALFGDYSRASDRQDIKKANAIRTGETSATVEIIFKLNGERHKVQRILNDSNSSARYYQFDQTKNEWTPGPSQVRTVDEKIISLLGMKQDLFCGTVILEQGKTGRFMELKPDEQVKHVIDLLGLNIYTTYYEQAKKLANKRKIIAEGKEKELKTLTDASIEKVENLRCQTQQYQSNLQQLGEEIEELKRLFEQAQKVHNLRSQITNVNRQIVDYEKRVSEGSQIRFADAIVTDWKRLEPQLREKYHAIKQHDSNRQRVDNLKLELGQTNINNAKHTSDVAEFTLHHQQAKEEQVIAFELHQSLHNRLIESEKQRDLIAAELELDSRINEIQTAQSIRQEQLQQLPQIEANYNLWNELQQVGPELKTIVKDLREATEKFNSSQQSEQDITKKQSHLDIRCESLVAIKKQAEAFRSELVLSENTHRQILSEFTTNNALLKKRELAQGQSICPTCGTRLEGEQLDRFHRELMELREKVAKDKRECDATKRKVEEIKTEVEKREQECQQQDIEIIKETDRLLQGRKSLEEVKTQGEQQKQLALAQWQRLQTNLNHTAAIITAPTDECLNNARVRLKLLNGVDKEYIKISQIQTSFDNAECEIIRFQDMRKCPAGTFNKIQFTEVVKVCDELAIAVKDAETKLAEANRTERKISDHLGQARQTLQTTEQRIQKIEQELLPQEETHLRASEELLREATERFDLMLSQSDWPLQHKETINRASNGDKQAETEIRAWVDGYLLLATKLPELQHAEREIDSLRVKRDTWIEETLAYSKEAQETPIQDIEKRLSLKRGEEEQQKQEEQRLSKVVWEEEQKLARKEILHTEYEQLVEEEKNFRDLANLLAPPGRGVGGGPLLRHVMRGALERVAQIASNILDDWGQSIEVVIPKDSLEFRINDRANAAGERYYQLFSGGEKFMVALAMALAIGEVASNTGQLDCLFIDEGFGLLDTENRARVAQEIVSNLVKSGRRKQVIVITHMEDLQSSAFTARYHLVNDGHTTRLLLGENDASA